MWLWIKHWLDWAMSDVLPLTRHRPHGQAVHTRYEKAGLSLYDLPVPWNADAVVVEVLLRLPPVARRKADFVLRLPGRDPVPPEGLRPEGEDRHRLLFRIPPPAASTAGELLWKHHLLARVNVPILTAGEFLAGLSVSLPTVAVRLGKHAVPARTYVASQNKGLVASAVIRSRTPLAPIADLGLRVVFRSERSPVAYTIPITLSSTQLAATEAVVTAVSANHPRRAGGWAVSWQVGDQERAMLRVQGIGAKRFEQALRLSDTRFLTADKAGVPRVLKQAPPLADISRLGPCFLLANSEPGVAGLCPLQVHAVVPGEEHPPLLAEQEVLITDGPTVFAPGLVDVADLARVTGFELRHKGRVLGIASLSPVPMAAVNSEGGFKAPPDFAWSNAAEDELSERLARLMNGN